jgi:hypothetical protein
MATDIETDDIIVMQMALNSNSTPSPRARTHHSRYRNNEYDYYDAGDSPRQHSRHRDEGKGKGKGKSKSENTHHNGLKGKNKGQGRANGKGKGKHGGRHGHHGRNNDDPPPLYGGDYEEEENLTPCTIKPLEGGQSGDPACPCVQYDCIEEDFQDDKGCLRPASFEASHGATPCYHTTYGHDCLKHDEHISPTCGKKGSEGNPDLEPVHIPDWCGNKWCWVDPDNCYPDIDFDDPRTPDNVGPKVANYFKPRAVYWNYETCGAKNTYEGSVAQMDATDPF